VTGLVNALWWVAVAALLWSSAALRQGRGEWRALAAAGLGSLVAECAVERAWPGVALNGALLALLLGDWWKRRGLKVAKVLGERGRAVIAGLLEKVRDAGSPLPEGVRA
jgi:hypothetical protein